MVSSLERRVSALNKGNSVENRYGNVNQKQQYNKLKNELTNRGLFNQTKNMGLTLKNLQNKNLAARRQRINNLRRA